MNNSPVRWMAAIVDRGKGSKAAGLFQQYGHEILLIVRAHGTASSAVMDCLGLDEPEKELVLGIASVEHSGLLIKALQNEMEFHRPGHGIAFTMPLSGISAAAAGHLYSSLKKHAPAAPHDSQKEDTFLKDGVKYELVASVINTEIVNPVMEAARKAGCKGGTLLKARELESGADKKIFGLTLSQEKAILLILTPDQQKQHILRAICETVLKETGEHALAISLPVDQVEGLHLSDGDGCR